MAIAKDDGRQNLAIWLERQTIRMVKILAERRSKSVSDPAARQIEILAGEEKVYEQAERQTMFLPVRRFHSSGKIQTKRDALYKR